MTIQQHAERISEWDGHSYANELKYDCCMEMGYAVLKVFFLVWLRTELSMVRLGTKSKN